MGLLDDLFDSSEEAKLASKTGMTKEVIADLFTQYDKNGDGKMDQEEFSEFAASLGCWVGEYEINEAMELLDPNGDGIDIKEFATYMVMNLDNLGKPEFQKLPEWMVNEAEGWFHDMVEDLLARDGGQYGILRNAPPPDEDCYGGYEKPRMICDESEPMTEEEKQEYMIQQLGDESEENPRRWTEAGIKRGYLDWRDYYGGKPETWDDLEADVQTKLLELQTKIIAAHDKGVARGSPDYAHRYVEKLSRGQHSWMAQHAKSKLLFQMARKKMSAAFTEIGDIGEGKLCSNTNSVTVGEIDKATCPGMFRFFAHGAAPADFAELNPPEGAKSAGYVELTVKPDSGDAKEKIITGAARAFQMFAEPILEGDMFKEEMFSEIKTGTGLEGEPYHSYRIDDCGDSIKFIIFSGLDVGALTGGVDISDWIPKLEYALYLGWSIGDLLMEMNGSAHIKDLFNAQLCQEFTWSTKLPAGIAALMKTETAKSTNKFMQHSNRSLAQKAGALTAFTKVFNNEQLAVEVEFEGYQDIAEAGVIDAGIPTYVHNQKRMLSYYSSGEVTDAMVWGPLGREPTEEEISNIIEKVGNVGSKTIKALYDEFMGFPAVFPANFIFNQARAVPSDIIDQMGVGYMTPLAVVKGLLSVSLWEMAPPGAKDTLLAVLSGLLGVKGVGAKTSVAQAGVELKGMDFFCMLPSEATIMAAPEPIGDCSDIPENPQGLVAHIVENNNFLMRFYIVEALAAVEAGIIPGDDAPVDMEPLKALSYTPEEVAEFQEKYSEVIAVLEAVWPLAKDAIANTMGSAPPPVVAMKDHGLVVFTKLTGISTD